MRFTRSSLNLAQHNNLVQILGSNQTSAISLAISAPSLIAIPISATQKVPVNH